MSDATRLPAGFRASGVKAGIKPSGGQDLALLVADGPCSAAGTFTTNRVAAAPVQWDRSLLPSEAIRAIVVNAGNANAATGAAGLENARRTATTAASMLACRPENVLVASTGVIGHQLPMDRVESGLARAAAELTADVSGFEAASRAILTTDTRPKVVRLPLPGECSLFGMAKGAAMIGPRMATMLAFLLTDAPVATADLDSILREAVDHSFNCVSVEGHTSTNDTVLLLAGGDRAAPPFLDDELDRFAQAVRQACRELAMMMADDGEGSTHRITIQVEGCQDREEARSIARTVADSPLVKTAIHGADPNWGRIVSAAGYSGVPFEESELSLWLNDVLLYHEGVPVHFDAASASNRLRAERDVTMRLRLKRGGASITFWTCDLSAEYVRLNADYTT
jgi:glutamate N-acetyltransferase/amino-acid N-acetyltransferase